MKIIKILGLLVVILLAGFIAAALIIPAEKTFIQETEINADAKTVWNVLNDRESFPEWQDQLERVEILDKDRWTEYPKNGDPISFRFTSRKEGETLELSYELADTFKGTWRAELRRLGKKKSMIRTTDKFSVDGTITKVIMAMFFDIEDFAADWNRKLKKRCEALEGSES